MSKTNKTRPYWVKVTEHPVESHNHDNGVCDIAGHSPSQENVSWRAGRCYFGAHWWEPTYRCGCVQCGIPKSERRKRRYASRQVERDSWRELQ